MAGSTYLFLKDVGEAYHFVVSVGSINTIRKVTQRAWDEGNENRIYDTMLNADREIRWKLSSNAFLIPLIMSLRKGELFDKPCVHIRTIGRSRKPIPIDLRDTKTLEVIKTFPAMKDVMAELEITYAGLRNGIISAKRRRLEGRDYYLTYRTRRSETQP